MTGQSGLRGRQIVAPISISAWAKSPARSARRQHARRPLDFASCSGDRLFERHEAREDAGDIAVDRRGLAPEGDRRDRRGGIGADAGKGAQFGLLARKSPAAPRDLLGAGVQVPRPGIIAEAGERADHGLDLGGGQILHPRPFGDEGPIVGRRRLSRGLLQQHFGQPDTVRVGRLARRRAPGERAAMAVPPPERSRDDRLSLCLPSQRAYIGAHAADLAPPTPALRFETMMKPAQRGAKRARRIHPRAHRRGAGRARPRRGKPDRGLAGDRRRDLRRVMPARSSCNGRRGPPNAIPRRRPGRRRWFCGSKARSRSRRSTAPRSSSPG